MRPRDEVVLTHGACNYMGDPKILVGKSNSSRHSICGASKNMVCDLRRSNFPLIFLVCSADLDMHFSRSFSHYVKFYSFIFMKKISTLVACVNRLPGVTIVNIDRKRWLFIDRANFVIL